MAKKKCIMVFVHGWSVTHTDTYGSLPERLHKEAEASGLELQIKDIFLGRYISFHDEVQLRDISHAFAAAVNEQLRPLLTQGQRFICITHSTGGPVIRDWWHYYYQQQAHSSCPMSHLIMLAPANYGSALAQLGKGRLSRMKFWFGGVEPGQGVLDWLELGSQQAWQLNNAWLNVDEKLISAKGIFPFVLTGQSINRALYDNLNSYTGESGSDGVVRVAAANLNSRCIKLIQQKPRKKGRQWLAPELEFSELTQAPQTALRVLTGKSHSGKKMGIMRSVTKKMNDKKSQELISAILDCLKVSSKTQYKALVKHFSLATQTVQEQEKVEVDSHFFLSDTYFFHDRYAMVIFNIHDQQGYAISDFDLILTAGARSDPNHLPRGFFVDKQRNQKHPNTITYYFNYDVMKGTREIRSEEGQILRQSTLGADMLGIKVIPRPVEGFVHYLPCEISASRDLLDNVLQPNSTTMIDICLQRVLSSNIMHLDKGTKASSFKRTKPGDNIVN